MWRRQRDSCIDTWAPIGVVLDVLAQWNRLIIFFLNAPSPSGLGFIGLYVPFGLFSEYIHLSKHELSVLEEKRGGPFETTIRYLSMDLLVHLEGEERQTL